jgi:CheY-like chemotaxis protein
MISGRIRDGGAAASHDLTRLLEGAAALDHGGDLQSGIDLMLAQAIVAAMDGQIHVEANQGPGVTITFELRTDAARQEDRQQSANALTKEARAAHILIVDDNATNRMVAETLCEMFGCTSEEAVDGVEAVEAATRRNFDLVLMDIRMPRMDGVTATRTIRALAGRAGQVPIIALTANADPEDISAYLAAGMNAVVEKPIKPEVLLAAIEDALSSPEAISRAA